MKKHLEIIKELGSFLLLFVLASAVAVSQEANGEFTDTVAIFGSDSVWTSNEKDTTVYEDKNGETTVISVTIVETSSSEDVDDTDTTESPDSEDNGNEEDTAPTENTDSDDSGANGNLDPGVMPTDFQPDDLMHDEYNDELWERIWSMVYGDDPLLTLDNFPLDITDIANVE